MEKYKRDYLVEAHKVLYEMAEGLENNQLPKFSEEVFEVMFNIGTELGYYKKKED